MSKLDRRTFLKVLGAGTAGAFSTSPLMNAFADPTASSKDCFIFIHQSGGWDVTLWADPRNRRIDIIEPATLDTITTAGLTGWVDDPFNDGSATSGSRSSRRETSASVRRWAPSPTSSIG